MVSGVNLDMNQSSDIALRMQGITKQFPGVLANDHIDLELKVGEVHALLGENGAGKTTLMKILYGLYQPDSGEIFLGDERVVITSPKQANDLGIGMVHQHFMLVENLTALENVVLGIPPERPPFLDLEPARARFQELAEEYNLDLDADAPVWQLPVGDQQWLEIVKILFRDARVLVLDEPTAVLAPAQASQLFETVRRFASEGRAIIFISHKLEEVREVADRITVIRDGHVIGTVNAADADPSELARMMVGRPVFLNRRERPALKEKKEVLVLDGVSCLNNHGTAALNDFSLTVHSGEIVGIAGVDGNGQKELAECISGLRRPTNGTVKINELQVTKGMSDPTLLGYVPEDRHKTGLILGLTIAENLVLKTFDEAPYTRHGIVNWNEIREHSAELIEEYDIRTPDSMMHAENLSGGNQQRVVVAREMSDEPALLVAAQPTRGLDVGSVEGVHKVLLRERNRGAAVLFISTELSEVMALSDRIVVMYKGEIMGEINAEEADVTLIGELMLGHREALQVATGGVS